MFNQPLRRKPQRLKGIFMKTMHLISQAYGRVHRDGLSDYRIAKESGIRIEQLMRILKGKGSAEAVFKLLDFFRSKEYIKLDF